MSSSLPEVLSALAGSLAPVAFTGAYSDLTGTPVLGAIPTWIKIATKTHPDFNDPFTPKTINSGYSLPARSIISGCYVNPTTPFSGGLLLTYTISVGIGSGAGVARYAVAQNVFTGVTITTPQALVGIESLSVATPITLTAVCNNAPSNATAGVVDIYLLVSTLP